LGEHAPGGPATSKVSTPKRPPPSQPTDPSKQAASNARPTSHVVRTFVTAQRYHTPMRAPPASARARGRRDVEARARDRGRVAAHDRARRTGREGGAHASLAPPRRSGGAEDDVTSRARRRGRKRKGPGEPGPSFWAILESNQ